MCRRLWTKRIYRQGDVREHFFFTPNDPRGQTSVMAPMAPGRHNQLGLEMCNVHRNFKRITPLSLGNKIIPSARTLLNKTTLKRENLERRKCIFPPRATFILLLASFLNKVPDCYLRCLVSWIPESILNLLTVIGIACQVRTPGWERRPSKLTGISSTVDFDPDGQWRTVSLPFFPLAGRWRPFHQSDSLPFL